LTGGAPRPTIRAMAIDPLRSYAAARLRAAAPPVAPAAAGVAVHAAPAWQDAAATAPAATEWVMGPMTWALGLAVGSLVLVVVLLPWFVLQLPVDYFVASRQALRAERTVVGWTWRILRNVLGLFFVLAGGAMLLLPGQGLLTILIGLLLLEFPGKRALERRLVARPGIKGFLDRIRARHGVPPLEVDGP
jgi:hypothetical protein